MPNAYETTSAWIPILLLCHFSTRTAYVIANIGRDQPCHTGVIHDEVVKGGRSEQAGIQPTFIASPSFSQSARTFSATEHILTVCTWVQWVGKCYNFC